jgi:hypothetical protein
MSKEASVNTDNLIHAQSQAANSEYVNLLKNLLVGGVAAGGAFRGGQGLINMWNRNTEKPQEEDPLEFSIPAPTSQTGPMSMYGKAAETSLNPFKWPGAIKKTLQDWATGESAQHMTEIPHFWLGAGAAGAGGLYAGYKGMDSLMSGRRKAELAQEEEDAKAQYQAALAGLSTKAAEEKLSILYQQKDAVAPGVTPSSLAAVGIGALGATAGLSGMATYNIMNSRHKSKLLAKAIKQRQRQQLMDAPVFAFPTDVATTSPPSEEIPLMAGQDVY